MGIGFSDDDLLLSQYDEPPVKRDVVFVPTNRWPYKRTDLAVQYVARWQEETSYNGRVILTGGLPAGLTAPNRPGWTQHRRLSYSELGRVMSQTRIVAFFSEYEGFGLPPVEGLLAGACPVYSELAVTREVMGDAGFAFATDEYASFADAMNKAMKTTNERIGVWRNELRQRHTWQKVCDRVISGLQAAECGA
jgi:glycosyltransferase involved in cell wall biosynthesis